jgi:hypothetical protein
VTRDSIFELADAPDRPGENSQRLDAVIDQLPKYVRARLGYRLYAHGIRTLADLCATRRSELRRWKNVGKTSITHLEGTLASLGLTLAGHSMKRDKHQTRAQRVANPVWLRAQIGDLVESCEENIAEDQELADKARDDAKRGRYLERVDSHKHWKRQLERILRGETPMEAITAMLSGQDAIQP